ncbi:pentapeptide repeat-containing protein [Streptomyces sp. NPDC086766]|uniref:pentapeptide repeat-containing protein n=1 Tax=Streptomyces sp. NPDC086766 TaxID=3365754 RepID=UPI00381DBC24
MTAPSTNPFLGPEDSSGAPVPGRRPFSPRDLHDSAPPWIDELLFSSNAVHCAAAGGPSDCEGRALEPAGRCLAHLDDDALDAYLNGIGPGSTIEHQGTHFTADLLGRLLDVLRDPGDGRPHLGNADFNHAVFDETANFGAAVFADDAVFRGAVFEGEAVFSDAKFSGADSSDHCMATFRHAHFKGGANFRGAIGRLSLKDTHCTGRAVFDKAELYDTSFSGAEFESASFKSAQLFAPYIDSVSLVKADFTKAQFPRGAVLALHIPGEVVFNGAVFDGEVTFEGGFGGVTEFRGTRFSGRTTFSASFTGPVFFSRAVFGGITTFDQVNFHGGAAFDEAVFEEITTLGPLACDGVLDLSFARINAPLFMEAAARRINFRRVRWAATATLRLRHAAVDFTGAALEYPVGVSAQPSPFAGPDSFVDESALAGSDAGVRLVSLAGVDATHLMLSDVDLSGCRFIGAFHLDQLRLEGCRFAPAPEGIHWRRWVPVRWTPRQMTLAEEHYWREDNDATGWMASSADTSPWSVTAPDPLEEEPRETSAQTGESTDAERLAPTGPVHTEGGRAYVDARATREPHVPGPTEIGPVYRKLRKSFEDSGNEPDAADFYYGEMEMRRHDGERPPGERWLLTAYWALSGYGLRASRAIGWLLAAMTGTVLLMMLWGLPVHDPEPASTGVVTGQRFHMVTTTPDPESPDGPFADRLTAARLQKSLGVVVTSVIFRSSGQDLTTAGTVIEMGSRLAEPALLGLGLLAFRGRIKR